VKILAPGFYAQKDIKTPVKIAVFVLVATQIANLALVPWLAHAGLALSVGLGACANALLLLLGLRRRGLYQPSPGWMRFLLCVALALAVLAAILVAAQWHIDWTALHSRWMLRLALLGGVIAAAAAGYFAVLWLCGYRPRHLRLSVK
jgi:putative peptidoglycan lipid II flippase